MVDFEDGDAQNDCIKKPEDKKRTTRRVKVIDLSEITRRGVLFIPSSKFLWPIKL